MLNQNIQNQSKKIKALIASGDFKSAKEEFIAFSEWSNDKDIRNASYLIASQFSFLSNEINSNLRETDSFYQKVIYAILEHTDKINDSLSNSNVLDKSKLPSNYTRLVKGITI